jgi:radical SAM protein with 4Fe4S-binding SPASM domain
MKLPQELLIRTVRNYTHILNPYNGFLITLKNNDYESLHEASKRDLETEIIKTIILPKKKQINSRKFRSSLIELGSEYKFPTIVNIELTRRCILDCKHCYITSEEHKSLKIKGLERLNRKEVESLVKSLQKMGVFVIVLTGGEPCIAKNILYFVEACEKNNIIIELFTCLQIIPKWLLNGKIKKIGRIQISIYSLDNLIHDEITNKQDSLQISLKNITILKKLGYYIEAVTPLMKINYKKNLLISDYFKKKKIAHNFSWPILNEYYTPKTSKNLLNISKEQLAQFVLKNPDYIIKCQWKNKCSPLCEAGSSVFSISGNGDVFPCSQYPLKVGNIFKQNVVQIYKGKSMKTAVLYKAKDLCKKSEYYNFCIGNNYSETGDPLKQPQFMVEALEFSIKKLKKKGGKMK